jgi:hypothetical protein
MLIATAHRDDPLPPVPGPTPPNNVRHHFILNDIREDYYSLCIWDADSLALLQTLHSVHVGFVKSMQFNHDCTKLLAVGEDIINVWSLPTENRLVNLKQCFGVVNACFDGSEENIVSATDCKRLIIWNIRSEEILYQGSLDLFSHKSRINEYVIVEKTTINAPIRRVGGLVKDNVTQEPLDLLNYWSYDHFIVSPTQDIVALAMIMIFRVDDDGNIIYNPSQWSKANKENDQKMAASASNAANTTNTSTAAGNTNAANNNVANNNNNNNNNGENTNKHFCVSTTVIALWDVATNTEISRLYPPFKSIVYDVTFSADASKLATSSDYSACVWDVPTGTLLHTITCEHSVHRAMFSPSGNTLVVGVASTKELYRTDTHIYWPQYQLEFLVYDLCGPEGSLVQMLPEKTGSGVAMCVSKPMVILL